MSDELVIPEDLQQLYVDLVTNDRTLEWLNSSVVAKLIERLARETARADKLKAAVLEAKHMLLPSMFGTPSEEVERLRKLYYEALYLPAEKH